MKDWNLPTRWGNRFFRNDTYLPKYKASIPPHVIVPSRHWHNGKHGASQFRPPNAKYFSQIYPQLGHAHWNFSQTCPRLEKFKQYGLLSGVKLLARQDRHIIHLPGGTHMSLAGPGRNFIGKSFIFTALLTLWCIMRSQYAALDESMCGHRSTD
jgi:hypothetical protein